MIVRFTWEDAVLTSEWKPSDGELKTATAEVCGILIHEDEGVVTTALEQFEDGSCRQLLTIPKRLIVGEIVRDNRASAHDKEE